MKTLTVINENKIVIDGKTYVYLTDEPVEPEVVFKEGNWVCLKTTTYPYRVSEVLSDGNLWLENFRLGDRKIAITPGGMRLATPQEIESHLKKMAEEKGFIQGRKFKSIINDNGLIREIQPYHSGEKIEWRYIDHSDSLYCDSGMSTREGGCSNPSIYRDGVWDEIIPQESKELPKTIEELEELIIKARCGQYDPYTSHEFLREQGYKVD